MSNVPPTNAQPHPPVNAAGDGQVISENQVKQGRRGLHMAAVLAISTVLAIVVMFGLWSAHAGKMANAGAGNGASKAAAAQTFNTGPSQPKANPPQGTTTN